MYVYVYTLNIYCTIFISRDTEAIKILWKGSKINGKELSKEELDHIGNANIHLVGKVLRITWVSDAVF